MGRAFQPDELVRFPAPHRSAFQTRQRARVAETPTSHPGDGNNFAPRIESPGCFRQRAYAVRSSFCVYYDPLTPKCRRRSIATTVRIVVNRDVLQFSAPYVSDQSFPYMPTPRARSFRFRYRSQIDRSGGDHALHDELQSRLHTIFCGFMADVSYWATSRGSCRCCVINIPGDCKCHGRHTTPANLRTPFGTLDSSTQTRMLTTIRCRCCCKGACTGALLHTSYTWAKAIEEASAAISFSPTFLSDGQNPRSGPIAPEDSPTFATVDLLGAVRSAALARHRGTREPGHWDSAGS